MSDFQKWSVLAFRAMDDAGRVLMTIEPESTTEAERLDQLKETIRELLTQVLLLNGVCTRRQLDERFQFGKLDTGALNVQLGQQQQQAEPVSKLTPKFCTCQETNPMECDGCRINREQQAESDRWVIEKVDGKLLLNGAEIDPGTIEVRTDGLTYRASEKVEVRQQAEPVGQLQECLYGRGQVLWFEKPADLSMLYTAPPQRKPLTDEQILDLIKNCPKEDHEVAGWIVRQRLIWCRAIEAAHHIKEQP